MVYLCRFPGNMQHKHTSGSMPAQRKNLYVYKTEMFGFVYQKVKTNENGVSGQPHLEFCF